MALIGNTNARWSGSQTRDTKELVLDAVVDTAPMQTPLLQILDRGEPAANTKIEWIDDHSGAYPTTTGDISYADEGDDFDPQAVGNRTVLFNYTQIVREEFGVTRTQQSIARLRGLYGGEDELDYQAEKKARQIVRQVEASLLIGSLTAESNTNPNDAVNSGRKAGGVDHFINNIASYYSEGTLATAAQPYSVAMAGAALARDDIEAAYAQVAENGGVREGRHLALCNSSVKRIVNKLFSPATGSTSIYRREFGGMGESMVDLTVDLIETDFGKLDLMWHIAAPAQKITAFEPGFWEINVMDDIQSVDIAKTADGHNRAVLTELSWRFLAPNTFWQVTGITA